MLRNKPDKGNYNYQKFVSFIKKTKKNRKGQLALLTVDLVEKIFMHIKDNLENEKLYIKDLNLTDREDEIFNKFNSARLQEDDEGKYINLPIIATAKTFVVDYQTSFNNISLTSSREKEYVNAKEIDDNLIIPNSKHDYENVLTNLFYNNEVVYEFNNEIECEELMFSSNIQTCEFNVTDTGNFKTIPVKFKTICTHNVDGHECGNEVFYCLAHRNSKITCTDSNNLKGKHSIKTPFDKQPLYSRKLYHYILHDRNRDDEESNRELHGYSLEKLDKNIIKCNCVYVDTKDESYVMIISTEKDYVAEIFKDKILIKDKTKNPSMIKDIYVSIIEYYKKHHNILLTDENRILWELAILVMLCKTFFDEKMNTLFIGESGTGKTFLMTCILPLFTFREKRITADVTPTKFLGGQGSSTRAFLPGYVATQDVVFLDEITSALQDFNLNKGDKRNVITMMKDFVGKKFYERVLQGSNKCKSNAVVFGAGNIENMKDHLKKYRKALASRITNYSGERNIPNYPFFRSVQSMKEHFKTNDFAKAHTYVRNSVFNKMCYFTGLEDAERARFPLLICLEEPEAKFQGFKKGDNNQEPKQDNIIFDTVSGLPVHREDFLRELKSAFHGDSPAIPQEFSLKVTKLMDYFIFNVENNFLTGDRKLNRHISITLHKLATLWLWMEKTYWNEPLEIDLKKDSELLNTIFLYLNNSLTTKEAACIVKPKPNNFTGFVDLNDLENFNEEKKKEYRDRMEKEKNDMGSLIDF